MSQIADLVDLRRFTPGRAAFAAKAVRALCTGTEDADIAEEAGEVVHAALQALNMRRSWSTHQVTSVGARGGGKAVELDNQLDRLVAAVHDNSEQFVRALPADAPEGKLGREVLQKLFPRGVAAITSQAFEDQDASVEALLEELEGPLAKHVQALGLTPLVKQLGQVRRAFHDALQSDDTDRITYDEVVGAENVAQETLSQLVVLIAAKYRKSDAASTQRRGQLLAPIIEQNERIVEARRRRRAVTDVDPETGEEQEVTIDVPSV